MLIQRQRKRQGQTQRQISPYYPQKGDRADRTSRERNGSNRRRSRAIGEPFQDTCGQPVSGILGEISEKSGQGGGGKSWKHLNPNADLFGRMMEALGRAMVCDQWNQDGGRFIPNPATWLNQRRWEDEPEVVIPRSNPRRTYDLEAYEEMDFRNTRPFWD